MKKLLVETMDLRFSLNESANGGRLIAKGRFALADVPTANGRVYKRALWEREIKRLKPLMAARKVYGEADHPADGRTMLKRVAFILTDLNLMEDGEVIGTAEIIDTTSGKELKAIYAAGGALGVSSRGYGSVSRDANGNDEVEDDFQLDTFDFVVDPAQGTAYPEFHTEGKATPEGTMKTEGIDAPATVQPDAPAADAPAATDAPSEDKPEEVEDDETQDPDQVTPPVDADAEKKEIGTQIEQAVAKAKAELYSEVESKLLSDPKVAGARAALESVKQVLRPFILDKDVNAALEEKDVEIKALKAQVEALSKKDARAKVESIALARAVKDLGFKLYVEKTLAGHPKLESLVQSFGDLTLVENVEALQKLVAPHKDGLKTVRTEAVDGSRKLVAQKDAEIKRLGESLKTAQDSNKKVVAERNEAVKTAHEASLKLYLDRKIAGNPRAPQIRLKFQEMKTKSKESVDALVEAFHAAPPSRQGSDFGRIRSKLAGHRPSATLVEDSIKDTGPQNENGGNSVLAMQGVNLDVESINRLAGVK